MTITRERWTAFGVLLLAVLAVLISLDMGRGLIASALSGLTAYGTALLFAVLLLSVRLREVATVTKALVLVAAVVGVAVVGIAKAFLQLAGVDA